MADETSSSSKHTGRRNKWGPPIQESQTVPTAEPVLQKLQNIQLPAFQISSSQEVYINDSLVSFYSMYS